ncbi:MAG: nuclear transport factor 2 family protein [Vicinamibacteria bacterium]
MLWSVWVLTAGLFTASGLANDSDHFLKAYYEAYRTGTVEELAAFYTEDVVFDDISQRHHAEGKAAFTEALESLKDIHVEMSIEEKRRLVSGNMVVVEILYKGTLDCAKLGRPDHDNLPYVLPAVLLFEVSKGRIRKQTDYIDYRTFSETFAKLQPPAQPQPSR